MVEDSAYQTVRAPDGLIFALYGPAEECRPYLNIIENTSMDAALYTIDKTD